MTTRPWVHVVAVVALVYGALAAVTVCAVTHNSASLVVGVIASTVPTSIGLLLVGRELGTQVQQTASAVQEVHAQVNGRMSQLIAAATDSQNAGTAAPSIQEGTHGG